MPNGKRVTGMPGWVKAFAGIGVALLVVAGIMLATGHGPGHHMPAGAMAMSP